MVAAANKVGFSPWATINVDLAALAETLLSRTVSLLSQGHSLFSSSAVVPPSDPKSDSANFHLRQPSPVPAMSRVASPPTNLVPFGVTRCSSDASPQALRTSPRASPAPMVRRMAPSSGSPHTQAHCPAVASSGSTHTPNQGHTAQSIGSAHTSAHGPIAASTGSGHAPAHASMGATGPAYTSAHGPMAAGAIASAGSAHTAAHGATMNQNPAPSMCLPSNSTSPQSWPNGAHCLPGAAQTAAWSVPGHPGHGHGHPVIRFRSIA